MISPDDTTFDFLTFLILLRKIVNWFVIEAIHILDLILIVLFIYYPAMCFEDLF